MAKYDRDFLVPYLQDICALHLAKNRVEENALLARKRMRVIQSAVYAGVKQPEYKEHLPEEAGIGTGCTVALCGFGALIGFFAGLFSGSLALGMGSLLVGVSLQILTFFLSSYLKKADNLEIDRINQRKQAKYEEALNKAQEKANIKLERFEKANSKWQAEADKIDTVLMQVYSANIIPSRYRDMYASVFLYDWFSTSQADDLDMALNMFVLEDIKSKLDRIIENQTEVILNQRVMIANQYNTMEQQERHAAMLSAKLDQIAASNEERNVYLSMIEGNTAANAYFTAADYLKN